MRNAFNDRTADRVLRSFLEAQDGKGQRKYKVVKQLPSADEFKELKRTYFTTTIESLIGDAYSELEMLADEMQSWFDNLTDGLQQADRGQRVEEAASALSNHTSAPDVSEALGAITTFYIPGDTSSRADRCSEACSMLRTASEALRGFQEDNSSDGKTLASEVSDDIDSLVDEVDNTINEVEGVEFPGMYG